MGTLNAASPGVTGHRDSSFNFNRPHCGAFGCFRDSFKPPRFSSHLSPIPPRCLSGGGGGGRRAAPSVVGALLCIHVKSERSESTDRASVSSPGDARPAVNARVRPAPFCRCPNLLRGDPSDSPPPSDRRFSPPHAERVHTGACHRDARGLLGVGVFSGSSSPLVQRNKA